MTTTKVSTLAAWLLATRPRTLTATVAPVLVATALAWRNNPQLSWTLVGCALLCTFFLQITTNLVNDVADYQKGTDTADRLGPLRATANGWLTPRAVWAGAIVALLLATVFGIPLIIAGGTPILILGLACLVAAVAYTAGPFPLAYLGLGEVFVLIFFGWVAVAGLVFILTGSWSVPGTWLAGTQIGLLSVAMIAINNLRDIHGDRRSKKRTLAARFGESFIRMVITFVFFAPYALGAMWWQESKLAPFVPLLALPIGIKIWRGLADTPPSKAMNAYLGKASLHLLVFGILLAAALLWK